MQKSVVSKFQHFCGAHPSLIVPLHTKNEGAGAPASNGSGQGRFQGGGEQEGAQSEISAASPLVPLPPKKN